MRKSCNTLIYSLYLYTKWLNTNTYLGSNFGFQIDRLRVVAIDSNQLKCNALHVWLYFGRYVEATNIIIGLKSDWPQIKLSWFKYAQAVNQKVWKETENGERDWGETLKIRFFPRFTRPTGVRLAWDSYPTIYRFNVPVTIQCGIEGTVQSTKGHIQRRKSAFKDASFVNMAAMFFLSCDNLEATTWKRQLGSDNSECDNVEDSCQGVKTWIWTRVFSKKVILTS